VVGPGVVGSGLPADTAVSGTLPPRGGQFHPERALSAHSGFTPESTVLSSLVDEVRHDRYFLYSPSFVTQLIICILCYNHKFVFYCSTASFLSVTHINPTDSIFIHFVYYLHLGQVTILNCYVLPYFYSTQRQPKGRRKLKIFKYNGLMLCF
jgi:hypothetical protein